MSRHGSTDQNKTTRDALAECSFHAVTPCVSNNRPSMCRLGGYCHVANFRFGIRWECDAIISSILKHRADSLLGVLKSFGFGIALSHDFRKGRNEYGETALDLRLKNN